MRNLNKSKAASLVAQWSKQKDQIEFWVLQDQLIFQHHLRNRHTERQNWFSRSPRSTASHIISEIYRPDGKRNKFSTEKKTRFWSSQIWNCSIIWECSSRPDEHAVSETFIRLQELMLFPLWTSPHEKNWTILFNLSVMPTIMPNEKDSFFFPEGTKPDRVLTFLVWEKQLEEWRMKSSDCSGFREKANLLEV